MYNNQTMCSAYNLIKYDYTLSTLDYSLNNKPLEFIIDWNPINFSSLLVTSEKYNNILSNNEPILLEEYIIYNKIAINSDTAFDLKHKDFLANTHKFDLNKPISIEEYIASEKDTVAIDYNIYNDFNRIDEILYQYELPPLLFQDFHGKVCESIDNVWICGY